MAKWTRNHPMEYGGVLLVLGILLTVVSFTYRFASTRPGWLDPYHDLVARPEGNWNTLLFIVGPIVLIWGAWVVGEQIVLRRRFERLIDTPKRSEFTSRRRDLEDLSKRLPESFRQRISAKESEFSASSSRRSA